ncbi:hypothetical protein [Arthrobacter sp. 18067]|uniref:hypothetical protein n=1 Tax=Arthrobacter sp. 18067 TaxID=2681413 RepID=UPI00135C2E1D|nr:hypothetical protein [Arthrobacter sp. 18067]
MKDHVHERIGFREIDEHGNAVQAVSPHVPETAGPERKRVPVNPFIIALWVLDAGLAWFGMWALTNAISAMVGPMPVQSAESAQVNFMMFSNAPYALLGAALITAGLLFWHAVQWQKKRPTR